jgi:hypothetical protein
MVSSSAIIVTAGGEHLMCDGFSLAETIHVGNFEFIANYFDNLSFSPKRGDVDIAFMASTHSGHQPHGGP